MWRFTWLEKPAVSFLETLLPHPSLSILEGDAVNSGPERGESRSVSTEDRAQPALLMSPWQRGRPAVGGTHTASALMGVRRGLALTRLEIRRLLDSGCDSQRSLEMSIMCPWTRMQRPGLHNLAWPCSLLPVWISTMRLPPPALGVFLCVSAMSKNLWRHLLSYKKFPQSGSRKNT